MKTLTKKAINDFKKSDSTIEKLIPVVINQRLDPESMEDVVNHGINGGFSGFVYYSETHSFAIKNRKLITELLEQSADELGVDAVSMVASFGVFRNSSMDNEDRKDLYKYLGGGKPNQGAITNVMAWFAAEEVARYCVDNFKLTEYS